MLQNSVSQTGRVIAAMLRPHFKQFKDESPQELQEALAAAAVGNTHVKVLVRLAHAAPDDFIYVASNPSVSASYLKKERDDLIQSGIFANLAPTCDGTTDLSLRFLNPAGEQEVLTSMTPIHVGADCWIVVTSQNAADIAPVPVNLPFWREPTLRLATAVYVLSTALIIWLLVHMWLNLSRFRVAARRIRMRGTGDTSFRELNTIPELTRVAEDFDSLVGALTASQNFIKQAAEENTHALKAPLAVIAQSIEPLKRATSPSDAVAQRSLQLIERSVSKLDALASSTRDLEQAVADVLYPERRRIDLSAFLVQMLSDYEVTLVAQGKRLSARIAEGITAYANEDLLEPVIENLLENAAGFTPKDSVIEVSLGRDKDSACIKIADHGPGVPPGELSRIFERYVSYRPQPQLAADGIAAAECHQGLGLWIVKRNVEGLAGTVTAHNRESGGLEVVVRLRMKA
ncbi:MAG: HAMP domain-containing histidine kinase [Alphaproteobacteria bacterium]|nr:HAMP domain-containing histidine kinase [Alphaproteobacteria bacterium]MDE2110560.1 HAMP domain-containing histidine kinase [Alphaproteobacteria bacterium]MDE2492712.1 HAMP domain-containing histidine kinase [Alphaproteobacteria bacterium]